ncbi:hypothetical protein L249_4849 [Ophiocordyceps polyrhachis-furcata BCC 54312]|uniref:Uncharacterized protein n=1 Tax=Ophiocordyceps polyrhachis-furcata BCC 54312 TaxID=1330021 RepID=A0A367L335_9HYPO|nr:hypothetical protein L249_4849 [Ophiocordyceps polyrhachis-furcata BCC 54312]
MKDWKHDLLTTYRSGNLSGTHLKETEKKTIQVAKDLTGYIGPLTDSNDSLSLGRSHAWWGSCIYIYVYVCTYIHAPPPPVSPATRAKVKGKISLLLRYILA